MTTTTPTTLLDSGLVRYWSTYAQVWCERPATSIPDRELAAMSDEDRDVVREACAAVATPRAIMRLSNEAAVAGDLKMVAICERAAQGERGAIIDCARAIAEAQAQAD